MKKANAIVLSLFMWTTIIPAAERTAGGPVQSQAKDAMKQPVQDLPATAPAAVFGVVADIQYADKPDGGRGGVRRFRSSLQRLGVCVADFNQRNVACVVQLGDIVDSDKNYRVPERPDLSAAMLKDLREVLAVAQGLKMPLFHTLGNHDVDVGEELLRRELRLESFHYDFTIPAAPGWRFIVTNGMDSRRRSMGSAQAEWLSQTLRKAADNGERVICFNHYTLVQEAAPNHDILINPQPVLEILDQAGNVVAWFSGHDHGGGYAVRNDIHFVTLPAMVDAADKNAYATVALQADKLVITGVGTVESRVLPFPPSPATTTKPKGMNRPYTIVDTGQSLCYDTAREIASPQPGAQFYGQDAHYRGTQPAYRDNGDGTVSDLNTGLMWASAGTGKMTWSDAADGAAGCRAGGHEDWRFPTIKELYSLILLLDGDDPCGFTRGNVRRVRIIWPGTGPHAGSQPRRGKPAPGCSRRRGATQRSEVRRPAPV